jgi:CheY-like chemotaxis protein
MSKLPDSKPLKAPSRTVLMVEDEAATLRFYLAGLRGMQEFRLLAAENGAEALAVLQASPVDVVVTDLKMPVLDGYGLLAILAEKYPSLPVIVLTAVAEPGMLVRAERLGALRILAKPVKLSLLMEEIRAAASRRPQGIVQGLAISGLLQLLSWERKTATLTVRCQGEVGYLYVKEGELVHAACDREEGIPAVLRILGWDGAHVEFVSTCRVQPTLALPIAELLMNIALLRDRAERKELPPSGGLPPPGPSEPWYG